MTREETWKRLVEIGIVDGDMPPDKWILVGADFGRADLSGADLGGAKLSGTRLIGVHLSKAYLREADFGRADLSGADLSGANLSGANLRGADLSDADLSKAYIRGADLSGADLSKAYLRGADFGGADLSGAKLSGADLSGANLSKAGLNHANLFAAKLFGTDLSGAALRDADLTGADLFVANLFGADLSRAKLSKAYLRGAYLNGADFRGADLSGANFFRATLTQCNLADCRMINVNFDRADLSAADITGAMYWGVSTTGWIITGIKAEYIYFTDERIEKDRYRKDFNECQFEELFKSFPTIEIILEGGLNPSDLWILSALIEHLKNRHGEYGIDLAEVQKKGNMTHFRVRTERDEYLYDMGSIIKEAVEGLQNRGLSLETLQPCAEKLLPFPDSQEILAEEGKKAPVFFLRNPVFKIECIKADGSLYHGEIDRAVKGQSTFMDQRVFDIYRDNRDSIDSKFDELKEAFKEYSESQRVTLTENTDRLLKVLRDGTNQAEVKESFDLLSRMLGNAGAAFTIYQSLVKLFVPG